MQYCEGPGEVRENWSVKDIFQEQWGFELGGEGKVAFKQMERESKGTVVGLRIERLGWRRGQAGVGAWVARSGGLAGAEGRVVVDQFCTGPFI